MLIQHSNNLECWVVRCGSKKGYQEDMCFEEIGLHAQNMLTILGSLVKTIIGSCATI